MKIPESIYINPKAIAKVYSLHAMAGAGMVGYVPETELHALQKRIDELEQEKREGLLTHKEIYPRG